MRNCFATKAVKQLKLVRVHNDRSSLDADCPPRFEGENDKDRAWPRNSTGSDCHWEYSNWRFACVDWLAGSDYRSSVQCVLFFYLLCYLLSAMLIKYILIFGSLEGHLTTSVWCFPAKVFNQCHCQHTKCGIHFAKILTQKFVAYNIRFLFICGPSSMLMPCWSLVLRWLCRLEHHMQFVNGTRCGFRMSPWCRLTF